MKVAIVNNQAPFVRGGAELLAEWLRATSSASTDTRRRSCAFRFNGRPRERVVDHMLAARLMRLANVDSVVALKFPAYYVPHENKVLWLLHQFRQAYELWGGPLSGHPEYADRAAGPRGVIIAQTGAYLPEARRIYTNSEIVGRSPAHYTGCPQSRSFLPCSIHPLSV